MQRRQLRLARGFRVALGNRRSQAAEMVIAPGQAEGGSANRHRRSDQWLYVLGGTGLARINGKGYRLRSGTLLLIEHRDRHEIRNTGRVPLKTLNIYVPPGYRRNGEELPAARP
jgi:mannose-6-phosphate isomerase-like protein (cupin superfamily)